MSFLNVTFRRIVMIRVNLTCGSHIIISAYPYYIYGVNYLHAYIYKDFNIYFDETWLVEVSSTL